MFRVLGGGFNILFSILLLFLSCGKEEKIPPPKGEVVEEGTGEQEMKQEPTVVEEKGSDLRKEIDALMAALEKKEEALKVRELDLDVKEASFRDWEKALEQKEQNLKTQQTVSYVILVMGIILIILTSIIGIKRLPREKSTVKMKAKRRKQREVDEEEIADIRSPGIEKETQIKERDPSETD